MMFARTLRSRRSKVGYTIEILPVKVGGLSMVNKPDDPRLFLVPIVIEWRSTYPSSVND